MPKSIYIKKLKIPNSLQSHHQQKKSEETQKIAYPPQECVCVLTIDGKKQTTRAPAVFFDQYSNGTRVNLTRPLNVTEIKKACKPLCEELSTELEKAALSKGNETKKMLIESTLVTALAIYGLYRYKKTKLQVQNHAQRPTPRL